MVQALQLSPLEELAVQGLMKSPRLKADKLFAEKDHEAQRLRGLAKDVPRIVMEYVNYILVGENIVSKRQARDVWSLNYDDVELTIALLMLLGKTPEQISDMLAAALEAEPTNSGKVKKYSTSLSHENRLRLKGTYPEIHRAVWERFPQVMTPSVIAEAIVEVRERTTGYLFDPDNKFDTLKYYHDGLNSGELRKKLIETYLTVSKYFPPKTSNDKREWLDDNMAKIMEHNRVDDLAQRVRNVVIIPIQHVLEDLKEEMGTSPFERAGYTAYPSPYGALHDLEIEVGRMQEEVSKQFPLLLQSIRKEKERELRIGPLLSRVFGA